MRSCLLGGKKKVFMWHNHFALWIFDFWFSLLVFFARQGKMNVNCVAHVINLIYISTYMPHICVYMLMLYIYIYTYTYIYLFMYT